MVPETLRCNWCHSKNIAGECHACGNAHYCSESCQKSDWFEFHSALCGLSRIGQNGNDGGGGEQEENEQDSPRTGVRRPRPPPNGVETPEQAPPTQRQKREIFFNIKLASRLNERDLIYQFLGWDWPQNILSTASNREFDIPCRPEQFLCDVQKDALFEDRKDGIEYDTLERYFLFEKMQEVGGQEFHDYARQIVERDDDTGEFVLDMEEVRRLMGVDRFRQHIRDRTGVSISKSRQRAQTLFSERWNDEKRLATMRRGLRLKFSPLYNPTLYNALLRTRGAILHQIAPSRTGDFWSLHPTTRNGGDNLGKLLTELLRGDELRRQGSPPVGFTPAGQKAVLEENWLRFVDAKHQNFEQSIDLLTTFLGTGPLRVRFELDQVDKSDDITLLEPENTATITPIFTQRTFVDYQDFADMVKLAFTELYKDDEFSEQSSNDDDENAGTDTAEVLDAEFQQALDNFQRFSPQEANDCGDTALGDVTPNRNCGVLAFRSFDFDPITEAWVAKFAAVKNFNEAGITPPPSPGSMTPTLLSPPGSPPPTPGRDIDDDDDVDVDDDDDIDVDDDNGDLPDF